MFCEGENEKLAQWFMISIQSFFYWTDSIDILLLTYYWITSNNLLYFSLSAGENHCGKCSERGMKQNVKISFVSFFFLFKLVCKKYMSMLLYTIIDSECKWNSQCDTPLVKNIFLGS